MALLVGARDLKVDAVTGDIVVESGDLVFVNEGDAIVQACRMALELCRGEWFLDEELGIPYYDEILVKSPKLTPIREIFRRALLDVAGVLAVTSLNLSYTGSTRSLAVTWRVSTDFGELSGSQEA
jgi:hypothetical protein